MGKLKKIACFDFDDTLCYRDGSPNLEMIETVNYYHQTGHKCYIVTARDKTHESIRWIRKNEPNRTKVKDFVKHYNLPIKQCHFTCHTPKGPVLKKIGAIIHFDDEIEQITSATEFGIEAILVDKSYHLRKI